MQDFRNDITNLLSHQHADATLDDSSRDTINNIVNSLAVYFFKALLQKGKTDIFSLIPSGLRNNAMIWCSENSKGVYLKVSNRVISLDKLGAISSEYGNLSQQDLNVVGCCIEYIVAELVDESLSKTNEITGKILVSNIRKDKDITSLLRKAKITIGKPRSRRAGSRKSRRGGSRKSRRAGSRNSRRAASRKSRRAGSRKSLVNKRMMTRVEKIIKKHIKDHGEDLSNLTVHMIRNNVNEKLKLRTDKEFRNTYIMPILMKIMNQ